MVAIFWDGFFLKKKKNIYYFTPLVLLDRLKLIATICTDQVDENGHVVCMPEVECSQ